MPLSGKADASIEKTLDLEAGFVNNPHDKGGPTRWGVTEATARAYGYNGKMENLPRSVAKQILIDIYWLKPGFDAISVLSPAIAWELFDAGVLSGPARPIEWLQRSLKQLNMSHKQPALFEECGVDGSMGKNPGTSQTYRVLAAYLKLRPKDGELVLLRMLNCLQGAFFISITDSRVQNEEFIYGWFLNRVTI